MSTVLKLEVLEIDNKFITRSKKTCLNKFRYTRQEKLNELDDVAGFLIALGRIGEAIDALESVLDMGSKDGEEGFWMTGNSRVLLSYAYTLQGNDKKANDIKRSFIENGMDNLGEEDLAYFYSEYKYWKEEYKNETHKYRCQVLVRTIFDAVYLMEMWAFIETAVDFSELDKLKTIISEVKPLLVNEING